MTGATTNTAMTNMTSRSLVSVCIPAYQAQRHLESTLAGVLAQHHRNLEVVVVDNNSSDGTAQILDRVDDPRVRVVRNATTVPMVANFNIAVRESRGAYVKVVCADDLLAPECVGRQASVLDNLSSVALVSARTDFVDGDGTLLRADRGLPGITGRQRPGAVIRRIVRSGTNPVGPPVAAMFRRADFDRCGGFREQESFLADLDLWPRLLELGDFFGVPETLATFRIRSDSATALTSAGSQLRQQLRFADRLADDARWNITGTDRMWGRVRSYDMSLRRTGLYLLGAWREKNGRGSAVVRNSVDVD